MREMERIGAVESATGMRQHHRVERLLIVRPQDDADAEAAG
jgi:hypothetical protein